MSFAIFTNLSFAAVPTGQLYWARGLAIAEALSAYSFALFSLFLAFVSLVFAALAEFAAAVFELAALFSDVFAAV